MSDNSKDNYWINSSFFNFLQRIIVIFFGLSSFVLLARCLSTEQMGVWANFLALTANIELIRNSVVRFSFIKHLNTNRLEDEKEIIHSALSLNILITILCIIFLITLGPLISTFLKSPGLNNLLLIYCLGLMIMTIFSHSEWILNAKGNFKLIFFLYAVRQSSWFILLLIHILKFGSISLITLTLYYCLGILIGTIFIFFKLHSKITAYYSFSKKWLRSLWNYGRIILGSATNSMIFKNVDQFLVSNIISLTAVAFYNTSTRIINLLDIPSQIIGDILFPKSAILSATGNKNQIKFLYEKSVGAVLSIVLPGAILIFLFPKFIITLIAGEKYTSAYYILRIMLINSIFTVFIKQFATIMDSTGKAKTNLIVINIMAIISSVACFYFIKYLGVRGATLGITLTHMIGFFISQTYLYKYFGISFWNSFLYIPGFYIKYYNFSILKIEKLWK